MRDIFLTNSLTRKKEKFEPINPPNVGMYSCGPTVYDYSHIGHLRRYVGDDVLKKTLEANGLKVKHVMNITDVGHLTSDADTGEDKIEKSAQKTGKSAWDIAKFFENQFFLSTDELNIKRPDIVCRATDHIKEQIELIEKLDKNEYTYKTEDGIYFDTSKLPDYGKLTGGKEGIKVGARIDVAGKKNPTDFALWKFSPKHSKRQMEWESPWGVGFPGWHIECSAMSMKYLGETFDIHGGGMDNQFPHHECEIAQSECSTGKPFVKYWIHNNLVTVNGQKMSKSLGNFVTLKDLFTKYDPIVVRFFILQSHYRSTLDFSEQALDGARSGFERLQNAVQNLRAGLARAEQEGRKGGSHCDAVAYDRQIRDALDDDLNAPQAIGALFELSKEMNALLASGSSVSLESLRSVDNVYRKY